MPIPAPDEYEVLIFTGDMGLSREIEYQMKEMDFGDGYYASVLTGNPNGLVKWNLKYTAGRDFIPQKRWYYGQFIPFQPINVSVEFLNPDGTVDTSSPEYHPVSVYEYLRDFYKRHMKRGNVPFWFEDIDHKATGTGASLDTTSRKRYLCRFTKNSILFTQGSTERLDYSCSLEFKQVRGWPSPPAGSPEP